jgi:vanillate O-demethylase monooxygenase subunit
MFLLNQWYAAALPDELTDKPIARTICGHAVVMFRSASGQPVALDDRCPHRYAPLSAGRCEGENIVCPYHGIVFDKAGSCVRIPHQPTIPSKMHVRSYPLVERWGWAWIWMGDATLADASLIPPYEWFGSPEWKSFYRYFHVKANWELCADNLLDLSHTPYVHPTTIGTPDMDKFPLETWTEGNNVLYQDAKTKIALRLTNPLTPETERTTHIWFTWSRNFGNDDSDYVEKFEKQSSSVQDEDNRILEIQQAVVDRGDPIPTVPIKADSALLAARRTVQRLLREEDTKLRKVTA